MDSRPSKLDQAIAYVMKSTQAVHSSSHQFMDQLQSACSNWRLKQPYPAKRTDESVGEYGERVAVIYLQRKGFFILEQSYRIKSGEIDIIAVWRKRVVVFVEVKTWAEQRENSGGPSDAVDDRKQEKITRTALTYMKRHRLLESSGRADVIEVVLGSDPKHPSFRHFENAFEAVGEYQMFS